jgi:hypothetical protein
MRRGAAGTSEAALPLATADSQGYFHLPTPTDPGYDRITYGTAAEFKIWYLRGTIHVHATPHSLPSQPRGANSVWENAIASLTHARPAVGGESPIRLGPGTTATHELGPSTDENGFQRYYSNGNPIMAEFTATRYFGAIEFEGVIEPHDAPGAYRFRRWVHAIRTEPPRLSVGRQQGPDTSLLEHQITRPDAAGRVYDLDGPGHLFVIADGIGATQRYEASFDERLAVGNDTNPSPPAHSILAHATWRFHANYRIADTPANRARVLNNADESPDIEGVTGYTQLVEEAPLEDYPPPASGHP